MFKIRLSAAAAALAGVVLSAGAGQAEIVNWTISNGTFADGGTLSGTFTIDTTADTVTAYDLVTTPGTDNSFPTLPFPGPSAFGVEYSGTSSGAYYSGDRGGYPIFAQLAYTDPNGQYVFTSQLDLTSLPFTGTGTYALGGTEELYFDAEFPTGVSRDLTGGTATAVGSVPEPATWAMMLLGLGALGLVLRRRAAAVAVAA